MPGAASDQREQVVRHRGLWGGLAAVVVVSFAILGWFGKDIYQQAPPVPDRVVSPAGVLLTGKDILDGQNVWQSIGGQEVGSIWGHGAYVAPDWSADWLHREAGHMLDALSLSSFKKPADAIAEEDRAALRVRLERELRANTYDPTTGDLVVSAVRARAMQETASHYQALFGGDESLAWLRDAYAIPAGAIADPERARKLTAFFFWTSWACTTNRPHSSLTYTSNWPPEELVGNRPPGSLLVASVGSMVLLLAGVGALAWYFAARRRSEDPVVSLPERDPLLALNPTPSMRATLKYFWIAGAMFVVQVLLGALSAHYGVEGSGLYGFPLAEYLPYAVTRTWHVQMGLFWIATAWLGTGLFIAPAVSGYEPPRQKLLVNVLFAALVLVVVGSMAGEWLGVAQKLGLVANFWIGHQGYEYVDLGRLWQIMLLAGLFLWFGLMARAMLPALKLKGEGRHLLALLLLSAGAIALFYGAGLFWGRQTNLAIAEYWRWWVVHLWVEGFFEVFATVVIAFLFVRMGLLRHVSASATVLFSTIIFLAGGIVGTFHHLYFSGTPLSIMALGATFSALEVVPLVLIGFEAWENLNLSRARPWVAAYKWPIYCFVAVAFWNLVGAGLFGFFINTPIALYYMQGLNTTAVHAHTALFGVYGMLGIGLMLFCLKGLAAHRVWKTGAVRFAFWSVNIGLGLMVLLSVLPVGLTQAWASVERGMWYARSAGFMQSPLLETLRWMRMIGDTVFTIGVIALGWFVLGLRTGWSLKRQKEDVTHPGLSLPFGASSGEEQGSAE